MNGKDESTFSCGGRWPHTTSPGDGTTDDGDSLTDKAESAGREVGYVTRAVVFCVASAFLIDAAVSFDPQKAQGLDGSLRKTAATPLGPWVLSAVALGLVIFGLYSWCEARWRMVEPG